jgi:hypothetical protein
MQLTKKNFFFSVKQSSEIVESLSLIPETRINVAFPIVFEGIKTVTEPAKGDNYKKVLIKCGRYMISQHNGTYVYVSTNP